MNERTESEYERQSIINRLLDVWHRNPDLRLGQLLLNAGLDYNVEDYAIIRQVENYYKPKI